MARIRTIKPDFFLDDELDQLSEIHQKLFIGLWVLSDNEGKLADQPKKIKAQVFPYREYDVDELLTDLWEAKFIVRYDAAGAPIIKVLQFKKHQRPHPKEQPFGYPEPTPEDLTRPVERLEIEPGPEQLDALDELSRGKKRLAVSGFSSIPSSPARKGREGVLDSGKEFKEGGSAKPPPLPEKPEDPFSSGQNIFAYVQHERHANGYVTERPPGIRELGSWFSEFMGELNGDEARAMATLKGFFRAVHWRDKGFPFAAFMKLWRDFVPRKQVA